MDKLVIEPLARRSFDGFLKPLMSMAGGAFVCGALLIGITISLKLGIPREWAIGAGVTIGILSGFSTEKQVRNQLALAQSGRMVEATIDDARKANIFAEVHRAKYHFNIEDGQVISGKGLISDTDAVVLNAGSVAAIFYDPQQPRNNMLIHSMWGVTWDDVDEATNERPA